MIKYQAKIFKDGKSYSVLFPDIPGCFSSGSTLKQAIRNASAALSLYLEEARNEHYVLPEVKNRSGKLFHWISPSYSVGIAIMIRQARLDAGLSQNKLASKLGITVQQLQKLETPGLSNPTVKTLVAISSALDSTIEIKLVA